MSKSKDIRSYFISKSAPVKKTKEKVTINSDDDDIVNSTPPVHTKPKKSKKKAQVISSDSEEESSKSKQNISNPRKIEIDKQTKLKSVNIAEIFSNTPIKQRKVENVPKHEKSEPVEKKTGIKKELKHKSEANVHANESFENTLADLDDDCLMENLDVIDRTIDEELSKFEEKKVSSPSSAKTKKQTSDNTDSVKKRQRNHSDQEGASSKKQKLEHVDSGIDPDQEKFEKKRYSAALYQQYLNRGGPKHHGSKQLPKGKPTCLQNLTFLRTGVLDSLTGEEFENLVVEHGGKVVHGVSKKVSYVVVGDEPGPSKLQKARSYNIPEISEDELLDLILRKSDMKPHFVKNLSEDGGIISGSDSLDDSINNSNLQSKKQEKIKTTPKKSVTNKSTELDKNRDKLKNEPKEIITNEKHNVINKESKSINSNNSESSTQSQKEKPIKSNNSNEATKSFSEDVKKPQTNTKLKDDTADKNVESLTWTEKYKPTSIKNIIGQQDNNSNMNKLKNWLSNWFKNRTVKLPKPSPWNQHDGAALKCALLSGPPGVGKTTTATLVAKELGFDICEFNASDTRNKKLLHEQVSQLLSTNTIAGFAAGEKDTLRKRVLLMDEVDGMAGNEDRGGIQEIISLIKSTKIPIICMCNDRGHQKMRTLVTYCYDLRFSKPSILQIRGAMMSICFKEGLDIKAEAVAELISGTGCDIRQTLNHLSMWSAGEKQLSLETVEKESKSSKKDVVFGPWEVVKKVFNDSEKKNMTLGDKFRLFFYDYSMGPLFVQENYLQSSITGNDKQKLLCASKAADSLSRGDLIESKIRGSNNWALLETQAFFSSVLPGHYMSGAVRAVNFPAWLGKNSKKSKLNRMLSELHGHTRSCTSGTKMAIKLDYLKPLRDAIIKPLKKDGTGGIPTAVNIMKAYNLLREDLNNLIELCQWRNESNPFNAVDSKVKAAFTRSYNKEVPMLPFSLNTGVSKKKASSQAETEYPDEEAEYQSDSEHEENIDLDAMIKKKSKEKKAVSKPSTSKGKAPSRPKPPPKGKAKDK